MPTRKLGLNLVVIVAVAALFTGLWALYNRPVSAPDWPEQISGFSYSPFRAGQSPMAGTYPSDAQIREGMKGTLCRCMTYYRINAAIRRAAQAMKVTA